MQSDLITALVVAGIFALAALLAIKVCRRANTIQTARCADTQAAAETLVRAYGLAKTAEAPDPAAEHIRRLARMRAQQRQHSAQPLPVRNPGPGLRPHPAHGIRTAAPAPAYVIPPAFEPIPSAGISTADTPDKMGAAVIHSMTLPIGGGEQAGEFAGAGASGSWSSDTGSSPATSSSD